MAKVRRVGTLVLREWEVWHTYSTFFSEPIKDLHLAGRGLVDAGIALCAVHQDGTAVWRNDSGDLKNGTVTVVFRDHHNATIKINPRVEAPEGSFISQALYEIARLRYEELRLFGDHPWVPENVRLALGRCDFFSDEIEVSCYPLVTLYASGVIHIELRVFSPEHPVYVKDFVNHYVNLYRVRFNQVAIPPGLAHQLSRSERRRGYERWGFRERWDYIQTSRSLGEQFTKLAYVTQDEQFSFELVEINRGKEDKSYDTLSLFSLNIVDAIGLVLSEQRPDLGSLLFGFRPTLQRGNFWTGRPHAHIIRHANQAETAQANEERHRADFGWILARMWSENPHEIGSKILPENLRQFGDYGVYFNLAASMRVWARQGMVNDEGSNDLDRGRFIYGHQAVVQLVEYVYMLHRQFLDTASGHGTSDQVFAAKREFILMRQIMYQFSHYGEVRDLLLKCWDILGVPETREVITNALEVREAETELAETRSDDKRNRLLTFAFGLAAVPSIAEDVIQPLWRYLSLWRPATDEAFGLLTIAASVGLVVFLIRAWESWLVRRPD